MKNYYSQAGNSGEMWTHSHARNTGKTYYIHYTHARNTRSNPQWFIREEKDVFDGFVCTVYNYLSLNNESTAISEIDWTDIFNHHYLPNDSWNCTCTCWCICANYHTLADIIIVNNSWLCLFYKTRGYARIVYHYDVIISLCSTPWGE